MSTYTATPSWFEHAVGCSNDAQIAIYIDAHGPAWYGVHWLLQEFLAVQNEYRASLLILPALVKKFNTTAAVLNAVVYSCFYKIEDNEFFYSPALNLSLKNFENFKIKQQNRAQIGALKKRLKIKEQIQELELKLSEEDSGTPQDKHYNTKHTKKTSLSQREKKFENLQKFKKFVIENADGFEFQTQNTSFRSDTQFRIKDGYLHNLTSTKLLSAEDALEIWQYLFSKQTELLFFIKETGGSTK